MTKSNIQLNPLQFAYQNLDEAIRSEIRDKIIEKTGISLPQFYMIVRNGRTDKLKRKIISKCFGIEETELFPG